MDAGIPVRVDQVDLGMNVETFPYWRRFNRRETIENEHKFRRRAAEPGLGDRSRCDRSIIVLDAHSDEWMSAWQEKFRKLQINHLRSPLFFHPDPRDRDALLAFSHLHSRTNELQEIPNVVGKELSKHRVKKRRQRRITQHLRIDDRDRIDYFTPSAALFQDFCGDIVDRYGLRNVVVRARVENVEYGDLGGLSSAEGFTLTTDQGAIFSRIAVLAVGPGCKPFIPIDSNLRLNAEPGSVCHCFDTADNDCLPEHVLQKIDQGVPTSVVVVGGGLTSAQIADLIICRGVTKVWLLLRGSYKLKHFDVDLEWVSKVRNQQMSVFWSADSDQERMEMLKEARNGGSITPKFDRILQRHVLNDRLAILTHTRVEEGIWCDRSRTWSIRLSSGPENGPLCIDHIIYATGAAPNIEKVPCMQQMLEKYPVRSVNGLPRLTDDLMWYDGVPLFLTGGLAALRLGPGAANLAGARQGAERIAWKIEDLLGEGQMALPDEKGSVLPNAGGSQLGIRERNTMAEERSEYTGGFVNQFEALTLNQGT
ncbi:FAD binding domain protein [Cladophialophora carrionii]|uniref:FAD binding domain protein n=1 Tax=Cladophialophora carrionii TaxID=86049 RepID=A0A1C1CTD7_9EURO|nr:FAD binding domain protein [Cladophialophora carrionii]